MESDHLRMRSRNLFGRWPEVLMQALFQPSCGPGGLRTGSGVSGSEEDPARAVVPLEVTQRPKPVGKRSRGPRDFYVLQTRNNIGYGIT